MLKYKKVDTNTTTLGQINQAELIRAVYTFEQVYYKTEISKYTYSRVNCCDYISYDPKDVAKKDSQQEEQ